MMVSTICACSWTMRGTRSTTTTSPTLTTGIIQSLSPPQLPHLLHVSSSPLPAIPSSSPSSAVSPSSSSSSVAVTVGRECAKCLSYLTRALDGGGAGSGTTSGVMMPSSASSRPATLLRALGVVPPMQSGGEYSKDGGCSSSRRSNKINNDKMYELTPNGRGVMIRLENNNKSNHAD